MKTFIKILIVIVIASGGFFILRSWSNPSHKPTVAEIYYCPMHPEYTSPKQGVCPICNMNLVKRKKSSDVSEKDQVEKHLTQICVMHNCHQAHGRTPCPMMAVVKKGEKVSCPICGEHVAGLWDPKMKAARGIVSIDPQQRQLIGLKTTAVINKDLHKTIRVYGKVSRDESWIFAYVYEYDRPFLYRNEKPLLGIQHKAELEFPALPGEIFTGRVRLIDQEVDPVTRTTRIRVRLDEGWQRLKPDMSANVNVKIDLGSSLAVPVSAVMDTGVRKIVFVDAGNGSIHPREVVLGERADQDYQVKSGLKAGELVVVSGNFMIDSESRLTAAFEMSDAPEEAAAQGKIEGDHHGH